MLKIMDKLKKINFKPQFLKPQLGGLTRREFLLIAFMIIAVEGYLLYAYILKPVYDDYIVAANELTEKQETLNGLMADYARKDAMEAEILEIQAQLDELQKQLPAFLSQEEAIMYTNDLSGNSGLEVKIMGFDNAASLPLKALAATGGQEQQTVYETPVPTFVEQMVNIRFSGNFQNIYSFLGGLQASERKVAAKAISIITDASGALGGYVILSFPSLWDDAVGQTPFIMEPSQEIPGKYSPFDQYIGYSPVISGVSTGEGIVAIMPDFYLKVNSYLNNSAKVFISNSYNTKSEARYDMNNVARARMNINGGDGKYTYQYSLGTFNIVESKETEIKDGKVRLEVLVQARRSVDDKVGLILDISNNTDVPVEITVKGDDTSNPRFVVGTTAGNVVVK